MQAGRRREKEIRQRDSGGSEDVDVGKLCCGLWILLKIGWVVLEGIWSLGILGFRRVCSLLYSECIKQCWCLVVVLPDPCSKPPTPSGTGTNISLLVTGSGVKGRKWYYEKNKNQTEPAGTKMVTNLTFNRPRVSFYADFTTLATKWHTYQRPWVEAMDRKRAAPHSWRNPAPFPGRLMHKPPHL